MRKPPLERFAPRSRLRCCGTCANWGNLPAKGGSKPGCYVHRCLLPSDMTAVGCDQWTEERREFNAVALTAELREEGAQEV